MLKDIVEVRPTGGYKLYLRFEDDSDGEVDVSSLVSFHGIFEPLRDPTEFRRVRVDPELGTVVWPNGADLDPDVLYSAVTGQVIDFSHQYT
jgi:hypothetical protein